MFDPFLLIITAPAILLALYASWAVKHNFEQMSRIGARMSGAQAARTILDSQGLYNVPVELTQGQLSDHYDPASKVVRLSPDVYSNNSMAAVGIAAHEVGHAIQDAKGYAPLVIRNFAVPVASIGGSLGSLLLMIGLGLAVSSAASALGKGILLVGIVLFGASVFFQLVNLPVEFNASSRAKRLLVETGIVSGVELPYVSKVLTAAALTYVAATLNSVITLAYYMLRYTSASRD